MSAIFSTFSLRTQCSFSFCKLLITKKAENFAQKYIINAVTELQIESVIIHIINTRTPRHIPIPRKPEWVIFDPCSFLD